MVMYFQYSLLQYIGSIRLSVCVKKNGSIKFSDDDEHFYEHVLKACMRPVYTYILYKTHSKSKTLSRR